MTSRKIERGERRAKGLSYSQIAQGESDLVRGRFAALHERSTVTGTNPVPRYSALPAGAWSNQTRDIPPEPSFGVPIDQMDAIEQSLGEVRSGTGPTPPELHEPALPSSGAGSNAAQPKGTVETAPLLSRQRKRARRASK